MPSNHHARRAAAGLALAAIAALTAPAVAGARLIAPPGPWPTDIAGATNPLLGTPFGLNGTHATSNAELRVWLAFGRQHRAVRTVTVGRQVKVQGRLRNRDTRRSIASAMVTLVTQHVDAPGWTTLTNLATDRKGRFAARIAPAYHQRFAVIYYPAVTSPAPLFSRRVLARITGSVKLQRPYHRRRAYRFDGRVGGGIVPVPQSGLLIALQVRNRTGWITARIAKTTASGRFRVRYTFPRAARLKVRVRLPAQTAWPLYAGHSQVRTIHPR